MRAFHDLNSIFSENALSSQKLNTETPLYKQEQNEPNRKTPNCFVLVGISQCPPDPHKPWRGFRLSETTSSLQGGARNIFFAANRKICLMRQKFSHGKRPKLLNWPIHEDNLRITFTISELFKGMFWLLLVDRGGAGQPFLFLWAGRPSLPASLSTTPSVKNSSILKHKPSLAKATSLPSTYKVSEMENFKSLMKQRLDTMKQQCEILRNVQGHCLNHKIWFAFFVCCLNAESFKSCGRLEVRRP